MNNLQIFSNNEFGNIRTATIDGQVWFIGKDIAEALGYSNASKAVSTHVNANDRILQTLEADSQNGNVVKTQTALINESGLYALIFGSKLESAERFKHWVTSEVLPTLRKTGSYGMPQGKELLALAVIEAQKTIEEKDKEIERMRPKEVFADAVASSKDSILIGELAKLICQNGYSVGQNRLFTWMRDNGYLMVQGASRNIPKQRYVEQGLFEIKESSIANPDGSVRLIKTTKVTAKGQQYFIQKFLQFHQRE
nr:MAG TPA: repressor domain protein [Caudoviricetes sp.]